MQKMFDNIYLFILYILCIDGQGVYTCIGCKVIGNKAFNAWLQGKARVCVL